MYEYFSHPSDIGIKGIGNNFEEAFCEAAKGMFAIMANLDAFSPEIKIKIECNGVDREFLFINFLNKLLLEYNLKKAIFFDFKILKMTDVNLVAEIIGEKLKINHKNETKTEVKAATPCELKVEKQNDLYIAQCVLDI